MLYRGFAKNVHPRLIWSDLSTELMIFIKVPLVEISMFEPGDSGQSQEPSGGCVDD